MKALTRKLGRDLVAQAGQVLTIAVVIGCGIAALVAMRGTWKSLETSRDLYYQRYRFGDVFVHLSRAPEALASRLEAIDGVAIVEARLVEPIRLLVPGDEDPPRGYVVSLPESGEPRLNAVWVREGRAFEPGRDDEALLSSRFAEALGIRPGDALDVVMYGNLRRVRIVGIADSPEFIFVMSAGDLTADPARFAVLWMDEAAVGPAFERSGAIDDAVLRLQPGVDPVPVIDAVDRLLLPYGGTGAVAREDQPSHLLLTQEMGQLRTLATTMPAIFLGVAAFLLQVVLARMVQLQRTQIATLKAFGYTRGEIAAHYLGLVSVVGVLGAALGIGLGYWFGSEMTGLYAEFFHLPAFDFRLDGELVVVSVVVSVGAAVIGALGTVRGVVAMAPAEAMQPPSPPTYRRGWLDRSGLMGLLGPATRMMARDLTRRPWRLVLSSLGIAFSASVVVLGRFSDDAIGLLEEVLFHHAQGEDVAVAFVEPVATREIRALAHLPGVRYAEGQRAVAARFSSGHLHRDGALIGHPAEPQLRRLVEWPLRVVPVPERGITVTDVLARILRVEVGDTIDLETLFGAHVRGRLPIAGLVAEPIGLQGHVSAETLARLLGESEQVTEAFLAVEPAAQSDVMRRLVEMPGVLSATRKSEMLRSFRQQTGESRQVFTLIASLFGASIAVGVVYNNARITLSSRSRELASLRVLGFTRSEVAAIVLGEQAVQVAIGLPLGLWMGRSMSIAMMRTVDPETWRFPVVISPSTYLTASLVVVGAAAVCGWLVRRQVDRLDLVAVLKTRE